MIPRFKKALGILGSAVSLALILTLACSAAVGDGTNTKVDKSKLAIDQVTGQPYSYGGYTINMFTTSNGGAQYGGKSYAYCIERGKAVPSLNYTSKAATKSSYWNNLSYTAKIGISYASLYGFPSQTPDDLYAGTVDNAYAATQVVMWEFELGYRNLSGLTNRTLYDGYIKGTGAAVPYGNIEICIANHSKIPPYGYKNPDDANSGTPLTLAYNSGTGKYEGTFTDSTYINKSYFQVKTANGVEVSYPNSTTMKLAVSQYSPNPIPLTFEHKMPANAAKQAFFILEGTTDSRNQVLCTGAALDPKFYYVNVVTKPRTGTLTIRKTSEDGTAAGFSFNISGNGINRNVTTDGSGQASLSINEGTYTVTEIGTPDRYAQPGSQSVTIQGSGNHTLAFHNAIKKGYVRFAKKCTFYDGYLSGAVYRIYKSDGIYTGQALTSNAAQWVYSALLSYGDYYLQEYSPPAYYAKDTQKYSFSIRDNGASVPVTTYNKPTGDLRPEFITPNSVYRNGTEIVFSYLIHNDSPCEWTPTRPVNVSFKAILDNGTTINNNAAVVVPRFSYNLVYYKLKINNTTASVKLECTVTSPPDMDEPNKTNNITAITLPVVKNPESQTPDTKFENTPPYFFKPSETASVPTGGQPVVTSASWQQWEYSGDAFVLRTYGAALQPEQTLTPDVKAFRKAN